MTRHVGKTRRKAPPGIMKPAKSLDPFHIHELVCVIHVTELILGGD